MTGLITLQFKVALETVQKTWTVTMLDSSVRPFSELAMELLETMPKLEWPFPTGLAVCLNYENIVITAWIKPSAMKTREAEIINCYRKLRQYMELYNDVPQPKTHD